MDTRRKQYESMIEQLRNERSSFISHWTELSDYYLPVRSRWLVTDRNRGQKRYNKIVDNTGQMAARVLQAGMHSGITSPARPWVRLTTPDPDIAEAPRAKMWLSWVTSRMLMVFAKSNLYNVLPTVYGDCGVFGTAPIGVFEDDTDVIRCYSYPVGSYMIANDHRLRPTTFAREYEMTVRQIVQEFGQPGGSDEQRFRNISPSVRRMWEQGHYEQWVQVVHVIKPNDQRDDTKLESRYKPWLSCHYEFGAPDGLFLRESGYDECPILCPRWHTASEDVYGTDSPGIAALGDVKMLQFQQKTKTKAIDKMVDPPMIAPTSLKGYEANLLPGGITYVDSVNGQAGFRPAHEVRYEIGAAITDIQETQSRVNAAFYKDLFLMLAMSDRREITAREIAERHEEKMLMLGPVLERLNDELLDPLIDRVFAIMSRRGLIPEPPEELQGMPLKVEYISIMSQAQKMMATANIERFVGFAGSLAEASPEALDKVDLDQALDEYGDALGVPPSIVRDDEAVAQIRQMRAAQQAQAQQLAMLEQAAKGAKLLSETDTSRDSALTQLTSAM
jgi:hypothetical protein